jgi:mono/diheme cytochrome c family protein
LTEVKRRHERERILNRPVVKTGQPFTDEEQTMRRHPFLSPLLLCTLGALTATAIAQPRVDIGKREFDTKCAVCHGTDGKGLGPYAEQLKRPLPDLTTMAARNGGVFPGTQTYVLIEGAGGGHGTREMPVWGLAYTVQAAEELPDLPYNQAMFVRQRIMALLEYLNTLQVK